jgi:transposase
MGMDVSKATLETAVYPTQEHFTTAYTPKGIDELVERVQKIHPQLIVLEATGGMETRLSAALAEVGLPVVVVNPRQVRDFARATGILAKTDAIDAGVLARFGEAVKPPVRELPDACSRHLKALMARRRQLIGMLTQEKNRLAAEPLAEIRSQIQKHIHWLEQALADLDQALAKLISSSPVWREKEQLLRTVPGVGSVLSKSLVSDLPELGRLDRKQIAALVGLAPLNRDSGTSRGKRIVWGGRANVRSLLYMGTLTAIRCNPTIREFYQRLRKAGKQPKVALTACMRKLLTILNSMVKHHAPWSPEVVLSTS